MVLLVGLHSTLGALPDPRIPSATRVSGAPSEPRSAHEYEQHESQKGLASWYGGKFQGRMTANGEIFDTNELTAAHRTLPFDTIVRVVNPETDAEVTVRINDRGPFVEGRIIDLSRAAAEAIGIAGRGVAPVLLEIVEYPEIKNYRIIQIASFGSRSNADALISRLADAGFEARVETGESGLHRVVLPEVSLDEIEDYRTRLAELGHAEVLVREP